MTVRRTKYWVLQVRDVLVASVRGERPDLHALVRAAPVVADTVDALDVVDIMKRSVVHMALVHDEHGHFEGIVTSSDILEANGRKPLLGSAI